MPCLARLVVATALLLAAAAAVQAQEAPPTCSGYKIVYDVDDGLIASGPNKAQAADAAEQLAAGIAEELHKNEDCEVTAWRVEKACRKAVKKGQELEGGSTAEVSGTLYDMELVEEITCPDGGFKVRYEARGVMPKKIDTLNNIETRFIDVFDSTYV